MSGPTPLGNHTHTHSLSTAAQVPGGNPVTPESSSEIARRAIQQALFEPIPAQRSLFGRVTPGLSNTISDSLTTVARSLARSGAEVLGRTPEREGGSQQMAALREATLVPALPPGFLQSQEDWMAQLSQSSSAEPPIELPLQFLGNPRTRLFPALDGLRSQERVLGGSLVIGGFAPSALDDSQIIELPGLPHPGRFGSEGLRADRDLVMAAVMNGGLAPGRDSTPTLKDLCAITGNEHLDLPELGITDGVLLPSKSEDSKEKIEKRETLNTWLNRLCMMSGFQSGGEKKTGLANCVVRYLREANQNPQFQEMFYSAARESNTKCGDRVSLFLMSLGIDHDLMTFDVKQPKELADFLCRGVWAMNLLEQCAIDKIIALAREIDEVEVFLGYPVMLKEKLDLPINAEEMLYFASSDIRPSDLDSAKALVNESLSNEEAKCDFLISHPKWIESLKATMPGRVEALESEKEKASGEAQSNADYIRIGKEYNAGLVDLTKEILGSSLKNCGLRGPSG